MEAIELSLYRYTAEELKQILKSLVIIVDSREKQNKHILEYFKSKRIECISTGLSFGDYSYMLPASTEIGIQRDMYFSHDIIIERKASLEELSVNLAQNRKQFENEFLRAGNCKKYLIIESGSYTDIINHNYKTQLSEKTFTASLMTFQQRYDLTINFVNKQYAGQYIHGLFYYHLREFLK